MTDDDTYILAPRDQVIINAAQDLLWKLVRSTLLSATQVERVARVLAVLDRLPATSEDLNVVVSLSGPTRRFGEHEIRHWWDVQVEGGRIFVKSAGHFYRPSSGGDSFTSMSWSATPGFETEFNDYLNSLRIVDDAMPFEAEVLHINLTDAGYRVETHADSDAVEGIDSEEFDGDDDEEFDDDDGENGDEFCSFVDPVDESERLLIQQADFKTGLALKETCSCPPDECDFCSREFQERALLVDGRLRGDSMWANMCSQCFYQRGEGLGWGKGQLFVRRSNDSWLLVAGFSPDEEPGKENEDGFS